MYQQAVLDKRNGQIANCAWQYVDVAEASGLSAGYDAASRAATGRNTASWRAARGASL